MPDYSKLLATRFKDGGRGPDEYDCWGMAMAVSKLFGINLPDFKVGCWDHAAKAAIVEHEETTNEWQRLPSAEPGCLVLMATQARWPGLITHVGVYLGADRVLHTAANTGPVVVRTTDPVYGPKIVGYYKYVG
jgi:cell wall-associated NlpC family hydrolase